MNAKERHRGRDQMYKKSNHTHRFLLGGDADGHVLGKNIAGTAESVKGMKRDDVIAYHGARTVQRTW